MTVEQIIKEIESLKKQEIELIIRMIWRRATAYGISFSNFEKKDKPKRILKNVGIIDLHGGLDDLNVRNFAYE